MVAVTFSNLCDLITDYYLTQANGVVLRYETSQVSLFGNAARPQIGFGGDSPQPRDDPAG